MDEIISSDDVEARFDELLSRVEGGEEVVITRGEIPVARMIPERGTNQADLSLLVERVKQGRGDRPLNPDSLPRISVLDLVEDGRK